MKIKKLITLLLTVPLISSCGSGVSFNRVKKITDELSDEPLYPYYRVNGLIDFNGDKMKVNELFSETPSTTNYVYHARYNEGFYFDALDKTPKDRTVIYSLASKSYFLRAPLRITKENFYVMFPADKGYGTFDGQNVEFVFSNHDINGLDEELYSNPKIGFAEDDNNVLVLTYETGGEEKVMKFTRQGEADEKSLYNGKWKADGHILEIVQEQSEATTCAHYLIEHLITSYKGVDNNANPSKSHMTYELTKDGGFAFVGSAVHTEVTLDNYPYYPDPAYHPELIDEEDEDEEYEEEEEEEEELTENPLIFYRNKINAKVNIRFEYNKDGWLVKEEMSSLNYDYGTISNGQISLVTTYTYKFSD